MGGLLFGDRPSRGSRPLLGLEGTLAPPPVEKDVLAADAEGDGQPVDLPLQIAHLGRRLSRRPQDAVVHPGVRGGQSGGGDGHPQVHKAVRALSARRRAGLAVGEAAEAAAGHAPEAALGADEDHRVAPADGVGIRYEPIDGILAVIPPAHLFRLGGQPVLVLAGEDQRDDVVLALGLWRGARGLSIVMTNGSLQASGDTLTTGTFDTFDMDLNVADKEGENSFRVRRVPTMTLIKSVLDAPNERQHKMVLSELSTRLLGPIMNLILAALCTAILLRSSLLRRRASFAPAVAVAAMAVVMSGFMSTSNMISSVTEFVLLALAIIVVLGGILFVLFRK